MASVRNPVTPARDSSIPQGRERVLVIDDDLSTRESLEQLLETLGYEVSTAENGRRALSLLRDEGVFPRCILLDLMMPVMSGWQFLDERRKDPKIASIPVLVISGALDESAELPDVAGCLRKPVRPEQLGVSLERVRFGGDSSATVSGRSARVAPPRPQIFEPPAAGTHSTGSPGSPLRVLLIQENDQDALHTEALLENKVDGRFTIRRATTPAEALTQSSLSEIDVILLDVELTGMSATDALRKTVRQAPGVPFVVLTRREGPGIQQESLRWGAQDALSKELQTPELLRRSLRWAYERYRLRQDLEHAREIAAYERERRGLAQFAQPRMAVAAEMLGQSSLAQAAPDRFQSLVLDFIAICERAIKEREHELDAVEQRQELQKLAEALAALCAGPGDIVEIYQAALSKAWTIDHTELGGAKREEARLMLIALLGYVLASYRLYVGSDNRSRPSAV